MAERFERNARTVSLLTLVSRLTGLARDATLSRMFGAGPLMDAFFFAFMIPNLFRRLFGEGALAAAFLPVYAELERDDPRRAAQLASRTISRLMMVLSLLVLIGEGLLYVLSARIDHSNIALWLMMIMLPYMPMVCLVAILGAMLQVHSRFGPTAAAPIVLNLSLIIAAVTGGHLAHTIGLVDDARLAHIALVAAAVVVAGVVQFSWSLYALRDQQWWQRDHSGARDDLRRVMRTAGPMIIGLGVLQINALLDGIIASYPTTFGDTIFGYAYPLDTGAMAAVSFAQRLYQFPLGVFGIAIATAIFPLLARQSNDHAQFAHTVRRGLRLVVFIGLPASVGLMLVRNALTATTLQGGAFTRADTHQVGWILFGYAPAVWAYSMNHVLTRAFYARGDARTPVRIAIGVVFLNLALNCTLIWTPLREAGLAWSTSLCAMLQAVLLLTTPTMRSLKLVDRDVLRSWISTIITTALMAGGVAGTMLFFDTESEWGQSWTGAIIRLLIVVGVGAGIFACAAYAQKRPELAWSIGRDTGRSASRQQ
ncbi:MAG: murein biosynthesis integral membrane protein MurJ [Phycisphaerales bacterium]|nr:murein biosynthesis integral membrane protein MurJ [Phycisphaerales bacterium]